MAAQRRVHSNGSEGASQIHDTFSIQLEPIYRCATRGGDSDDQIVFGAPSKMVSPRVASRMEQRCGKAGGRVDSVCVSMLKPVATVTRKCQVRQSSFSPARAGPDVFHGKRVGRIATLREAVFAAAEGPASDPFPLQCTGATLGHMALLDRRRRDVQRLHD